MPNPGGWPTGPLDHPDDYRRRDMANALADMRAAVVAELKPIARVPATLAEKATPRARRD